MTFGGVLTLYIVFTVLLLMMLHYVPIMSVTYDLKIKDVYKNSFLLVFGKIVRNIIALISVAIPAFAGGGLVGDAGSAVASIFSSEFAGNLKSDIHITNFVDGKRAIDTDAIKTIVREVNKKDAKINSIMSKRVR